MPDHTDPASLADLLPPDARALLMTGGAALGARLGQAALRAVVTDIMLGRNLRDSTEGLTRRRLALVNAATVQMILNGGAQDAQFMQRLPETAVRILQRGRLAQDERWLAEWVLGLTDKASQNVLRDDVTLLARYRHDLEALFDEVAAQLTSDAGPLSVTLQSANGAPLTLDWRTLLFLLNMVGAQTLTIRGSEKSIYGKLFERLILGALLHMLGFAYTNRSGPHHLRREFWLSSRAAQRESDATLLWEAGQGARIDIGFIGRGNPEIVLDKVTRFARQLELNNAHWYMATIVIVDRIADGSAIRALATRAQAEVVQMSGSYWPQAVAQILQRRLPGYDHPLVSMPRDEISPYLRAQVAQLDIMQFLAGADSPG